MHGQEGASQEYDHVFQIGYDALVSGRLDEGIAAFERCLELRPEDEVSAYNLACSYSRKQDVDAALEWLRKSVDWGYNDLDHLEQDSDLDNIRGDPRYRSLVMRLRRLLDMEDAPEPAAALVDRTSHLIVMVEGRLGGDGTVGAGIVFGRQGDRVYIATANHVVRRGTLEATDLRIKLRGLPGTFLPAHLMEHADASLDLAVLSVDSLEAQGIRYCAALPLERLGDRDSLRRGDAVYPVGYPNGAPWGIPVAPDRVAQLVGDEITFQSAFISPGHSGGGLLTEQGTLVGMIRADTPPFGVAVSIARVLAVLQQWGYPIHLRAPTNFVRTPLHAAIEEGDLEAVRRLLDACAYVNTMNVDGRTPLHVAASSGQAEIARLLLEAGADVVALTYESVVDAEFIGDRTPLHLAAASGSAEVAEVLLAHGADVNAVAFDFRGGDWGGTPLHRAAAHGSVEVMKLLLAHGADVEATSFDGTPLALAVKYGQGEAMKFLLAHGAGVNTEVAGEVPLYLAADSGAVEAIRLLLEAGADPNVEGSFGTPLHRAARKGHVEVVRLLVEAGAKVDAKTTWSDTPLHEAASTGQLEVIKLLLEAGADVNVENDRQETPLDRAKDDNVVRLLRARGGRE